MSSSLAPSPNPRVQFVTPDSDRYGPRDHLLAIAVAAAVAGVQDRLQELGERDAERGRTGRAWREHSPRELRELAGRRRRYLGQVDRQIGSLLPPAFKPLALRFIHTSQDAMLDFIFHTLTFTPIGPPITDPDAVSRLTWTTMQRIEGRAIGPADRKHLERMLRRLDARDVVIRARLDLTAEPLPTGAPVSCSATAAASGSYVVVASNALLPGAGHVAGQEGDAVLIDPTRA